MIRLVRVLIPDPALAILALGEPVRLRRLCGRPFELRVWQLGFVIARLVWRRLKAGRTIFRENE